MSKIVRAVFAQSAKNLDFGLIWRQNGLCLQIEIFFGKTVWHVSCPYSDEHSCVKAKKSLEPFSGKVRKTLILA